MIFFQDKNILRISKLPFKFLYLVLCAVFATFGLLLLLIPRNRKRHEGKKVLCVSHVAISFDGRIKKTANQIVKLGMDVTILKPSDVQEDALLVFSGLDEKVKIKSIGLSGVFSYFPCVFDIFMFFHILFSKAKYLHCHDINTAFMGLLSSKITGQILISDLHEWKSETTNPNNKKEILNIFQKKIYQLIEKILLKKSDFVISVNELIAEKMKLSYKIDRNIFIVKNIPEFHELKSYNLREKLGIEPNFLLAYYIGHIAPYRNIDQILLAIARCDNVAFALQGTIHASYLNSLKEICKNLGISDRVFFLPPIAHNLIPSACQGADVGIFTCHAIAKSMYYSLPNKLFEYIMGEIPIISEDLPVVRPYIIDNNIGTLINSNLPETIETALNSYVNNREMLKMQKSSVVSLKEKIIDDKENYLPYALIYA